MFVYLRPFLSNSTYFYVLRIWKIELCFKLNDFLSHQLPRIYEFFESYDSIQYIMRNENGLRDEIMESCDYTESDVALPVTIFLAPQCEPVFRGESTIQYPEGFESNSCKVLWRFILWDVPLLLTNGQTIYMNTSTHILPPCGIWNDMRTSWHENLFQSLIYVTF